MPFTFAFPFLLSFLSPSTHSPILSPLSLALHSPIPSLPIPLKQQAYCMVLYRGQMLNLKSFQSKIHQREMKAHSFFSKPRHTQA